MPHDAPTPNAPPSPRPAAAHAVSRRLDTRTASEEIAGTLADRLVDGCDLLVVHASYHHAAALVEAMETIRHRLDPATSLAVTCESVVATDVELEGLPGISAMAMRLPGTSIVPWMGTPEDPIPISRPEEIPERIGLRDESRAVLMLGDPFSTPITRLLPALDTAADGVPIVGGMASGSTQPGGNVLVLDDRPLQQGVIGATISGPIEVDTLVSQGCRPVGEPMVITAVGPGHVITGLGGRPVMEALERAAAGMPPSDRELLSLGLLIGHVIDETSRPFGRGDFLVRGIIGLDRERGTLTVADRVRPGQTVQLHARDAVSAGEDLQLLLDGQQLKPRPFGALLFTCNGRGRRLFDVPHHDTGIIEQRLGPLPLAGFMAAGEIGPIGRRAFLHGHTAVLALFRDREPESVDAAAATATADVELPDPPTVIVEPSVGVADPFVESVPKVPGVAPPPEPI